MGARDDLGEHRFPVLGQEALVVVLGQAREDVVRVVWVVVLHPAVPPRWLPSGPSMLLRRPLPTQCIPTDCIAQVATPNGRLALQETWNAEGAAPPH